MEIAFYAMIYEGGLKCWDVCCFENYFIFAVVSQDFADSRRQNWCKSGVSLSCFWPGTHGSTPQERGKRLSKEMGLVRK